MSLTVSVGGLQLVPPYYLLDRDRTVWGRAKTSPGYADWCAANNDPRQYPALRHDPVEHQLGIVLRPGATSLVQLMEALDAAVQPGKLIAVEYNGTVRTTRIIAVDWEHPELGLTHEVVTANVLCQPYWHAEMQTQTYTSTVLPHVLRAPATGAVGGSAPALTRYRAVYGWTTDTLAMGLMPDAVAGYYATAGLGLGGPLQDYNGTPDTAALTGAATVETPGTAAWEPMGIPKEYESYQLGPWVLPVARMKGTAGDLRRAVSHVTGDNIADTQSYESDEVAHPAGSANYRGVVLPPVPVPGALVPSGGRSGYSSDGYPTQEYQGGTASYLNIGSSMASDGWVAMQTFEVTRRCKSGAYGFRIGSSNHASAQVLVKLWALDSNGQTTGQPLATKSVAIGTVASPTWFYAWWSNPLPELVPGNYGCTVEQTLWAATTLTLAYDPAAGYATGVLKTAGYTGTDPQGMGRGFLAGVPSAASDTHTAQPTVDQGNAMVAMFAQTLVANGDMTVDKIELYNYGSGTGQVEVYLDSVTNGKPTHTDPADMYFFGRGGRTGAGEFSVLADGYEQVGGLPGVGILNGSTLAIVVSPYSGSIMLGLAGSTNPYASGQMWRYDAGTGWHNDGSDLKDMYFRLWRYAQSDTTADMHFAHLTYTALGFASKVAIEAKSVSAGHSTSLDTVALVPIAWGALVVAVDQADPMLPDNGFLLDMLDDDPTTWAPYQARHTATPTYGVAASLLAATTFYGPPMLLQPGVNALVFAGGDAYSAGTTQPTDAVRITIDWIERYLYPTGDE
jgi:hypothetical protein